MSGASRRRSIATLIAGAVLVTAASAHADDGPVTALKNMARASPTLTYVTTAVVIAANLGFTAMGAIAAINQRDSEVGVYATQIAISTPQSLGFALAPSGFDIDRWRPVENLALLLPFQAWSSALLTHGIWSTIPGRIDPASRLGVSHLIGGNIAFTSTAIGCATRGEGAPFEVAVAEITWSGLELALAVARGVDDEQHAVEWGFLAGWSAALVAHGAVSIVTMKEEPGGSVAGPPPVAPFVTPLAEAKGVLAGVLGTL